MLDRNCIGRASTPALNEVEKGAIRRFAQALGDLSPLHHDEEFARASGYPGVVAPLTFPASFHSGADLQALLGGSLKRVLHAEQSFEYMRPIFSGDRIWVVTRVEDLFEKDSPQGKVDVVVLVDEGRDETGQLVFRAQRSLIVRMSKEQPQ